MPTLNIYNTLLSWSHGHRRHNPANGSIISTPSPIQFVAGSPIPIAAPGDIWENGNYLLTIVSGAADGTLHFYLPLPASQPRPTFLSGTDDVTITNVFLPIGMGGAAEPGLWIDAIDVRTAQPIDGNFAKVSPDPEIGQPLTAEANFSGFVDTLAVDVLVTALAPLQEGAILMSFLQWQTLLGPASPSATSLAVERSSFAICLALYQSPHPLPQPPFKGSASAVDHTPKPHPPGIRVREVFIEGPVTVTPGGPVEALELVGEAVVKLGATLLEELVAPAAQVRTGTATVPQAPPAAAPGNEPIN